MKYWETHLRRVWHVCVAVNLITGRWTSTESAEWGHWDRAERKSRRKLPDRRQEVVSSTEFPGKRCSPLRPTVAGEKKGRWRWGGGGVAKARKVKSMNLCTAPWGWGTRPVRCPTPPCWWRRPSRTGPRWDDRTAFSGGQAGQGSHSRNITRSCVEVRWGGTAESTSQIGGCLVL